MTSRIKTKLWFTTILWHKLTIITLLIIFPLYDTQNTYYIKPTAETPCPGEPCHTLSQYGEQYFVNSSANATLVFLPGDHTLNFTISVGTLFDFRNESFTSQSDPYQSSSSLTLLGNSSFLPEITSRIECTWPAGFIISGFTELHISALAFISCGHNDSATINILSVQNINISNCNFQHNTNNRSGSSEYGFGGAIYVHGSNLTIAENTFQHNFAHKGGALQVFANSTVTFSRNLFLNNSARHGGAFYASVNNTLTLSENTFQNSSADYYGGTVYVNANNTLTLTKNRFLNDSADDAGGALYVYTSNTLTLSENAFQTNSADYGGAVYVNANNTLNLIGNRFHNSTANDTGGALYVYTNNTLILSENTFQSNTAKNTGGAIQALTTNILTISENKFYYNSAEFGGALHASVDNTLTFSESTFHNNSAGNEGGALYVYANNTFTFLENTFQNNSADYYGGTVYVHANNTLTLLENGFLNGSADDAGGALYVYTNNTLTLSGNTFQNNSADYGGAVYVNANNTLNLTENRFHNSSANDTGGALYVYTNNTLTLSENTFQNNSADFAGGAFEANTDNTFILSGNKFKDNSAGFGGALHANTANILTLSENIFQDNSADYGGAVYAYENQTLTLSENTFQGNSADKEGAVYAHENNTLTLTENRFHNNFAGDDGGALYAHKNNTLTLTENTFQNNSADYGGAFYASIGNIVTLSGNTFQDNSADEYGGALNINNGNTLTLSENTFQDNSADYAGGLFVYINNTLTLSGNTFQDNSANYGGALFVYINNTVTLLDNTFQNNFAAFSGGVLYVYNDNVLNISDNNFERNSAIFDGGVLAIQQSTIILINNTLTGNTAKSDGGAVFCLSNSTLQVNGSNRLQNNTAEYGGAVAALGCQIVLAEDTMLENNTASYGGGLYSAQSKVSGCAHFKNNCAHRSGGGIYATRSDLYISQYITFVENSAQNGGGLLLDDDSKLYLQPNTSINFTNNFAQQKGGAIKVVKDNALSHCVEESCEFLIESDCFFQIQTEQQYDFRTNVTEITELQDIRMYFQNNTAIEAGAMLYGGSVDSCSLSLIYLQLVNNFNVYTCPNSGAVFDYITSVNGPSQDISSDPLYICSCEGGKPDCKKPSITRSIYPGGMIEVPIIAYGQRSGATPAVVNVITPRVEIRVKEAENIQSITNGCTFLNYTVQTQAVLEGRSYEMTLRVGPCPTKERTVSLKPSNVIKVHVLILQCPPGFELNEAEPWPVCNCAQRLKRFTETCRITHRDIYRESEFWVGYTQDNTSDGLILHPHCPFDYCTTNKMYIAVDDSDEQCSKNRKGLLCGKCAQNFSLVMGTNRCLQCSNDYLWLIVAFAFVGVALVLLLLVLRLTVAVGTINGLIFYANIIAINSATFFTPHTNVLTVFIAWLNLDLGIETCFYDGMDAYTKAWLQFVFPFYVWVLVGIIILISHYSAKVATILGTNPIAVLATLFLLSYAKFLRAIIVSLSYTALEYPNNRQISAWLYDANITYFGKKHVPLFTTALVCLIVLFLPYTVFLIFSQCLRSKSGRYKLCSWVNNYRVLPLLEAYHAPYTDKHRYWTGLLLLVRCALFLLFAFNTLGDPSVNLLAIGSVTVVLLIVYALLGNRIYKTWYLNVLELSFTVNLCILALATLYIRSAGGKQNAVTFTSVSVAFATFIGIVVYHSVLQIKHSPQLWRKMFPRNSSYEPFPHVRDLDDTAPPRPRDPSDGCATVSHINIHKLLAQQNDNGFRESCLVIQDD